MTVTVIIGHGRSPERKRWGSRIDACDVVVRMWDCAPWQGVEDYGVRYDYGVVEIGGDLLAKAMRYKKASPTIAWLASLLNGRAEQKAFQEPDRFIVVDQKPWNAIGKGLGGIGASGRLQFTRGTIAACWAIEQSAPGDEVVLVGMDNIAGGKTLAIADGYCDAYRKNPGTFSFSGYRGGQTKFGNHDYKVERPVMEKLAARHGVRLTFAQEAW